MPPENPRKTLVPWCISRSIYRKRPVPWNGWKIFLINMPAQCWYSCLFHNRACFLITDLHWFFQCTQEVKSFSVFWSKLIWRDTTASGRWSWQSTETINCLYYSIYFKGSQLKQTFFIVSIYFWLMETTESMYTLKKLEIIILNAF